MKRTRNGILVPDVPIMGGGSLPNAVKGVSSAEAGLDPFDIATPLFIIVHNQLRISRVGNLLISEDAKNWIQTESRTLTRGRYYLKGQGSLLYDLLGDQRQSDDTFDAGGNPHSLITYDYAESDVIYHLTRFFIYTNIVDASMLRFPDIKLATNCYTAAFQDCKRLRIPPILPSTQLAESCYQYMFNGCNLLEKAPDLPATIIPSKAYSRMFLECRSIKSIRCNAESMSEDSLTDWVSLVGYTGTFYKKRGVEYSRGNNGIPTGWSVEEFD